MSWQQKIKQPWSAIIGLLLFLFGTATAGAAMAEQPAMDVGRYIALVIGNRHYQHLEESPTAEADAKAMARMLEERYGFETELLFNADREQLMRALSRLKERVRGNGKDSLLVFYAGQGRIDKKSGMGYWLTTDARPELGDGWTSTTLINNSLKTAGAQHVLIASGTCSLDSLTALPEQQRESEQLQEMAETPSFTVLTAGCSEPVREFGAEHSQFAWTMLRLLHENQDILPGNLLFARMKQGMSQPPVYGSADGSVQAQGDFLFVPKSIQERAANNAPPADEAAVAKEEAAPVPKEAPLVQQTVVEERKGPAFDPATQPQAGDVMINRLTGMEFVYVPSGCVTMGAGSKEKGRSVWELPAHQVCVNGFWIGKYEVTQKEWQAVMGSNPSGLPSDRHPVENISWDDTQAFLTQLNSITGRNYRLPTEAEWEYACRAGGSGLYCGGNDIDSIAWHEGNSSGKTHEVGGLQPNAFGLYDMSGNVWEWCADIFDHTYYAVSIRYNPQGPNEGDKRVVRGGSLGSKARNCRAAFRFRNQPDYREDWLGFRIVLP